jgi:hypothetical protein
MVQVAETETLVFPGWSQRPVYIELAFGDRHDCVAPDSSDPLTGGEMIEAVECIFAAASHGKSVYCSLEAS